MPSPEVIDLTLSDDETQPDPIRSNQGISTPTRATNPFRTSSSTPPRPVSTELGEFFQSFKVPLQPSNKLKIISSPTFLQQHSFWTNTHQLYPQSTQAWYT